MSFEICERVGIENPTLLPANLGRTCFAHTLILIEKLRAAGHQAFLMCKSPGEGQYTPPGFEPRMVRGLDGKEHLCSGVSHDAIWCDHLQFDTLGSANEHDRPIYHRKGSNTEEDPNWSFDPNDGPQITARPAWIPVPAKHWRNNNPPFTGALGVVPVPKPEPQPDPKPAVIRFPSYAELGDDAFFRMAIGVPLQADATHAGETLNDGSSVWFSRATYLLIVATMKFHFGVAPAPDTAAIVRGVRDEWREIMQKNHPGLTFPPA